MIYPSDLNNLISQWTQRMSNSAYPQPYRDALFECCYDLQKVITDSFEDEIAAREAFESQMADDYLSTLEAHEDVA